MAFPSLALQAGVKPIEYSMVSGAAQLTSELKAEAERLGFSLAAACPAISPTGATRLGEWLHLGYGGEMDYIGRRQPAYADPGLVLEGARSILMLTLDYRTADPQLPQDGQGRISRYAWGPTDYHDVIHERLKQLVQLVESRVPGAKARGVVDSAPLLEREFAQLAGLGWIGKHTLLLSQKQGSYFFLAALLTDQELVYDEPQDADHCGSCTACLDACPTEAFVQPHLLDATRCISYLTIELDGPIPRELRPGIGDWLFGCDVCQDVCPWNRFAPVTEETSFQPRSDAPSNPVELAELFELDDASFRARFRHTPLWRAKRRGLLRNAAIVLGNQRSPDIIPALLRGLHDAESLVRGASAWALGEIGTEESTAALKERLADEVDTCVRKEIDAALCRRFTPN
jgi:epoxyqueuosine reductase